MAVIRSNTLHFLSTRDLGPSRPVQTDTSSVLYIMDDVVFSLIDTARAGHVEDNFNSKQKDFRDNLVSFWDHLVLECQTGPVLDNLFEKITHYVVALASTPPRVYRQVASLIGLQLVTSFTSVAKTLRAQGETSQRQLNTVKKKKNMRQSDHKQLVESLNRRLILAYENITCFEELTKKMLEGLLKHRYRDVDPEIWMSCLKSLGMWAVSCPSLFLDYDYLKYLGWALNDKDAGVRRASVLALQSLYEVDNYTEFHDIFTVKLYRRMIQLADDIDVSVAVSAIGLIKQLMQRQL